MPKKPAGTQIITRQRLWKRLLIAFCLIFLPDMGLCLSLAQTRASHQALNWALDWNTGWNTGSKLQLEMQLVPLEGGWATPAAAEVVRMGALLICLAVTLGIGIWMAKMKPDHQALKIAPVLGCLLARAWVYGVSGLIFGEHLRPVFALDGVVHYSGSASLSGYAAGLSMILLFLFLLPQTRSESGSQAPSPE